MPARISQVLIIMSPPKDIWMNKLRIIPASTHGGNDKHRYADTEAVRTGHIAGLLLVEGSLASLSITNSGDGMPS